MKTDEEGANESRASSVLFEGMDFSATRTMKSRDPKNRNGSPAIVFSPPHIAFCCTDNPQWDGDECDFLQGGLTQSPRTQHSPIVSVTPGSEMDANVRSGTYSLQPSWTPQGHRYSPQVTSRGFHPPVKSASLPSSPLFLSNYQPHEPPTHTIVVSNLSETVKEDDLLNLLSQFGELGSTHFENVHTCGSATAFYFNIEHSMKAMHDLQGNAFHGNVLEVHYKQPTDGSTDEEEMNQGTLFVHHLEKPVTRQDLVNKFQKYGRIRDIRSTPNKDTHRFVEFYDTRDAKAAMDKENGTDLCGNTIAIELSRPGGQFQQYSKRLKQKQQSSERRGQTSQEISPLILASTVLDQEAFSLSGDSSLDESQQTSTDRTHTPTIPKNGVSLLQPGTETHKLIPTAPADLKFNFGLRSNHHRKHHRRLGRERDTTVSQTRDKSRSATSDMECDRKRASVRDESLKPHKEKQTSSLSETQAQMPQDCLEPTKHRREDDLSPTLEMVPKSPREFITMNNWNAADPRTTLYVSNIPTVFTPEEFHTIVNNVCPFGCDYLYLQKEKGTSNNSGFGFINVVSTDVIPLIIHAFSDKHRALIHKGKPCMLEYAHRQSLLALLDQFDFRTLTTEEERWPPIILYHGKYMRLTLQLFFRMKYILSPPSFKTWRDLHRTEESIT